MASIKGDVALQRARCLTRLGLDETWRIPGVREAAKVGGRLDLRVDAAVAIAGAYSADSQPLHVAVLTAYTLLFFGKRDQAVFEY